MLKAIKKFEINSLKMSKAFVDIYVSLCASLTFDEQYSVEDLF